MVQLKISLPDGFQDEETRCDYTIPSSMKEVWAVELDLLRQLQDVCSKLGITYYAYGGTLLGAIRHKGFIPWDDDIDVTMLRSDYEKLCQACDQFSQPYEFQFFDRTEGYFTGHAQLRNTLTTGVLATHDKADHKIPYNQGIFIDIFPLDALPDDPDERAAFIAELKKKRKTAKRLYSATEGYLPERAPARRKLIHFLWKICPALFSYRRSYQEFLTACQRYNDQQTEYLSLISFMPDNEKLRIARKDLQGSRLAPFEFMSIEIMDAYDSVLKQQYGDYMKPVRGGSYHGGVIFDASRSYDEWKNDHA